MKAYSIIAMLAAWLFVAISSAQAQFSGGAGTQGSPYLIASANDLNAIRGTYLGTVGTPRYYRQTVDIDLSGISNWEPIGFLSSAYVHYNGNHKRISGLTVNRPTENYTGLFGIVRGSVSNLVLESGTVSGNFYSGGIAGLLADESILDNCASFVVLSGTRQVGGLVGRNEGSIRRSLARGASVAGTDRYVGGLVGMNMGTLEDCFAANSVSNAQYTGGLIGFSNDGPLVTDCYWDTQVSGQAGSAGGGQGVSTADMMRRRTFDGWDFQSVWQLYEDRSYPYLRAQAPSVNTPVVDPPGGVVPGTGTVVTVGSATAGAFVHYTTDGTVPQDTSPSVPSGGQVAVPVPGTLRTVAWAPYMNPSPLAAAVFSSSPGVPAPVLSPGAGSYPGTSVVVTVSCPTNEVTIRYTLDGSVPGESTPATVANGGELQVPVPGTLTVRAFRPDLNPSDPVQAVYSTADNVGIPVMNPAGGVYAGTGRVVAVTCNTAGALIYYTTDGTAPSQSSPGPIASGDTVNVPLSLATNLLQARAYHAGLNPSAIATGTYLRAPPTAAPVFDPTGGTFTASHVMVSVLSATAGATIRYTLDGATPDQDAPGTVTSGGMITVPVLDGAGTVLKARAYHPDYNPGEVSQAVYAAADPVAMPFFMPVDGQPTGTVMITCATPGATIRFTTDGTPPMVDGMVATHGGTVSVPVPGTLKARAWKTGMFTSPVRTAYYGGFAGGSGTASDPYLVMTAEQLDNARNHLASHFRLGADIDFTGTPWASSPGWAPIGTHVSGQPALRFHGSFDGAGHVVSNLFINRPGTLFVGLFGLVTGDGVIANLGLSQGEVYGKEYVGALVGYNEGTVSNCFTQVDVAGDPLEYGGVGGVVGVNAADGKLVNCYATGSVDGSKNLGGVVGLMEFGTVSNCYSAATVSSGTGAGGLIGSYHMGTVSGSYWDTQASGQATTGGNKGTGRTTAQMRQQALFAGWDFNGLWQIDEGQGYPQLQMFNRRAMQVPDEWLIHYYGSVDQAPSRSVKGTGLLSEYVAGTDPTDPASIFAVTHMARQASTLQLFYPSVSGRRYRVLSRADLQEGPGWQDVGGVVSQEGDDTPRYFEVPLPAGKTFYSIGVERLAE